MAPKEKISQAQIIEVAFTMTREIGFEQITTRKLAERLGCSTQPIFRVYANMEALKKDVHVATIQFFETYLREHMRENTPIFLNMGLAYVGLAQHDKNLFTMLTMSGNYETSSLLNLFSNENQMYVIEGVAEEQKRSKDNVAKLHNLSEDKVHEIFMMTWMFTHGIASMVASNQVSYSEEELRQIIIKAYKSFASYDEE